MTTGTRKQSIARKLKQWARLAKRQKQIEAERDAKLAPLTEKYSAACAPVVAAADARLSTLQVEMAALASQIEGELKAGAKPDGTVAIREVDVDQAKAIVTSTAVREIPAQDFFKSFPASQRDASFWSCLKVLLGEST